MIRFSPRFVFIFLAGVCDVYGFLYGQNFPVVLEVEDGMVGADFYIEEDNGVSFVSIGTNGIAGNPENIQRIIRLEIDFPVAQTYDLYVRCRVNAGSADDDSFFYGNGFGAKDPTSDADWIRANNIYNVGYTGASQTVDGAGTAGIQVWKWINMSEFMGDDAPIVFEVVEGELSQSFQIGAREDGLDIDKIAFARSDYFYTVSNLDNGEEGSESTSGTEEANPIAEGKSKFIGNVYSASQAAGFSNYWNQVTPENAGKWGSVERVRDNMVWTDLDAAYELAKENGFIFKLHVLIWGNQQPAWIEQLSQEEQLEEIKEWFQEIAERYPDMDMIEVVNEPLHDPPSSAGNGGGNYINALGGIGATGWDWILEAFRLARQYFPNAELMLNEYNIVNSRDNTNDYLTIINLLKEENLIDLIGVQAHAFSTIVSANQMKSNLDLLATTGLSIYVTELDIDGPTDEVQLNEYQRIFPVFWEHPAVKGITLWGYRPGMWRTSQGAFLIDQDGVTERPALVWLRSYVEGSTVKTIELKSSDHITIFPNPVRYGKVTVEGLDQLKKIEIYDLNGRKIWSDTTQQNVFVLDTPIAAGFYIIQFYDDEHVYSKKVMIEID